VAITTFVQVAIAPFVHATAPATAAARARV